MTTVVIWIGIGLLLHFFERFRLKKAAKNILADQKKLYSAPHEYRDVSPRDLPQLNFTLYDGAQRTLENLGCIWLGDMEDSTVSKVYPKMRTMIRRMLDPSRTVAISIYQPKFGAFVYLLKLVGVINMPKLVVDFETEFRDGTFLCTSNTLKADTTGAVPGIERAQLPLNARPQQTMERHLARLHELISARPERTPVRLADISAFTACMHRLQGLKNAHKLGTGFINKEEIERITGRSDQVVTDIASEIERLKAVGA